MSRAQSFQSTAAGQHADDFRNRKLREEHSHPPRTEGLKGMWRPLAGTGDTGSESFAADLGQKNGLPSPAQLTKAFLRPPFLRVDHA